MNKDLFDDKAATEASRNFALAAAAKKEAAEAPARSRTESGEAGGRRNPSGPRRG